MKKTYDSKINELQKQIDELKAIIVSGNQQSSVNSQQVILSSPQGALEQNIPNPFNHTTTINYSLPQQFLSAKIIITDRAGKVLKEVNISAKGKGSVQLDASTLTSGAYQYSLYVDAVLIDTRQMILSK